MVCKRVNIDNSYNLELFISIHLNLSGGHRVETFIGNRMIFLIEKTFVKTKASKYKNFI